MAILKIARMGHPVLRMRAEEIADPVMSDMFDYLYATLSPDLEAQRNTGRTSGLGVDPAQLDDAWPSGIEKAV